MKLKTLVTAGAVFAASCTLALGLAGVAVAEPAYDSSIAASGGASSADLKWTEPCSAFDMDGDGAADVIEFATDKAYEEEGAYEGLTLKVNDMSLRLLPKSSYFYYVHASYMNLYSADADAYTPVLWVSAISDNDYQLVSKVYRVSGGVIEPVFNLQSNASVVGTKYAATKPAEVTAVKGDLITVRFSPMTYTAASVSYSYKYRYNFYAGEFKRSDADNIASAKAAFWSNGKSRVYSPTVKAVRLYTKPGGSKYSVLAKGTKAKVTGIYTTTKTKMLRVKTAAGKTGYIKMVGSSSDPLFKYAMMAG